MMMTKASTAVVVIGVVSWYSTITAMLLRSQVVWPFDPSFVGNSRGSERGLVCDICNGGVCGAFHPSVMLSRLRPPHVVHALNAPSSHPPTSQVFGKACRRYYYDRYRPRIAKTMPSSLIVIEKYGRPPIRTKLQSIRIFFFGGGIDDELSYITERVVLLETFQVFFHVHSSTYALCGRVLRYIICCI